MESHSSYIPMDRRLSLVSGLPLPDRARGAALFADISGFTPLTEALALELGPRRGAEELTRYLNLVYDAVIAELHLYGGCVIGFSGDAITCWLDGDSGLRATACALAMQQTMSRFADMVTPSGTHISLALKITVAVGPVRRFLVGDAAIQVIDVLSGATLDTLATAEHHAEKGEVVLDSATMAAVGERVHVVDWRDDDEAPRRFAVIDALYGTVETAPWPAIDATVLDEDQVRPWLIPAVYDRLRSGRGDFLAELRPAVALFLHFGGIDYDRDEAAGSKLDEFMRQVQRILQRYEGSLLQLIIGDKGSYIYAAFGAPLAHEDDADRAVYAALELRALVTTLPYISGLQIGITRGRMRTGAYGGDNRRTYGVLGDAVNLAARLMQAAPVGQILVSLDLQQVTADRFVWDTLPDIKVKGKAQPVAVASLVGLKKRSAMRLHSPVYNLPMVGRTAEMALVAEKMALALQGHGQVVGITAEAGMGKSRLVAEIVDQANQGQFVAYGGQCQSYGTNTSYLVWQNVFWGMFELDAAWPLDEQIDALERQLAQVDPGLVPRLPLLGAVLNLPLPDNDLTRTFEGKLRKSSLEGLLVDYLRAQARTAPLLLVLEDCHWLDALSVDLIEVMARASAEAPVLLVLAYRPPELRAGPALNVSQLPHFTQIRLGDFTSDEAERLIALKLKQLFDETDDAAQAEVPHTLVARILSRAEGNPFYIEELLNYLHLQGIAPHNIEALVTLDLPVSLHSLILSRIDQLSESQQITLKVASIVGRLFGLRFLWGVYPDLGDEAYVQADLDALIRLDLTALESVEPEMAYLFKHMMTQEVAYESLPYAARAAFHARLGGYIETNFSLEPDRYLDLLAFHYGRSDNEDKKREYLLKAGQAAQADYANAAAIDYYRRALPLLNGDERVSVKLKLGQVLELVGDWDEAGRQYQQAFALAAASGNRSAQAWCETALGEHFRKQGKYAEAADWLAQARAGFETLHDLSGLGQVIHYSGTLAAHQGDRAAARTLYEESLAIRRGLGDRPNIASLLSNLGIVARIQGDYTQARTLHEEGLQIRRELGDKWAIAVSLNNLGNVALDEGDTVEARARFDEALALMRQVGDRWVVANFLNNRGNVARTRGDFAAARADYGESLAIYRDFGDKWALAYLLEDIGCLAAVQGDGVRAFRLVGAAAVLREEIGAPLSVAERNKLETNLSPLRQDVTADQETELLAAGRGLSMLQAIDYALADGPD